MPNDATTTLPVLPLTELVGNDVPTLDPLQHALAPYVGGIESMYWTLWGATLLFVIVYALRHGARGKDADQLSR